MPSYENEASPIILIEPRRVKINHEGDAKFGGSPKGGAIKSEPALPAPRREAAHQLNPIFCGQGPDDIKSRFEAVK